MEAGTAQPGGKRIDRIMLEMFRPIAPKPVPPGSDAAAVNLVPYTRTKRKYVKRSKSIKNIIVKEGRGKRDEMLDFADDSLQSPAGGGGGGVSREEGRSTVWICAPELQLPPPIYPDYPTVRNRNRNRNAGGGAPPRRVLKSWLEVYDMKEAVPGGDSVREKITNLQDDTCPVLISDGEQSVNYTNLAYKKLVDVDDEVEAEEAEEAEEEEAGRPLVWIVLKDEVPDTWTMFTCIGTVVYIWGKKKHKQTMPCDVWRMDIGGFLWRLDPESALKLGR